MDFIVKFAQVHETFRQAELMALASLQGIDLMIKEYDPDSPLCIVQLPSVESARRLIRRSILAQSILELWGKGATLEELHESVKQDTPHRWPLYKDVSFKFDIESYQGSRSKSNRVALINSFSYLPFQGPIKMSHPDESFAVYDVWPFNSVPLGIEKPEKIYFGRHLANSSRDSILKYDLKKREYISTTSMDSELSLVTANIALAGPGKLFYDPFAGTGSFPIACAHFGAVAWGSDIDGRSMRGQGEKSLPGNFKQYGIQQHFGDCFAADLTHTPLRKARLWDGIVCDPPYGVREGLRVLGCRDPEKTPWLDQWSKENYMTTKYVPPKKPYSFMAMLDDILVFATETLVDNGRLSFWMPTANDADQEIPIPSHPTLEIVAVCVQVFYKWSRRLITYRRIPDHEVSQEALAAYNSREAAVDGGTSADDLNPFRRGYFKGFDADR